MKYLNKSAIGLTLAGCLAGGCAAASETSVANQALTAPGDAIAFCTLQAPVTSADWVFYITSGYSSGDAAETVIFGNIQWDTGGTTTPSSASSGPMTGNPATWNYSLIVDGTVVTRSASVSVSDYVMTGTAANGATCVAVIPGNPSGGG